MVATGNEMSAGDGRPEPDVDVLERIYAARHSCRGFRPEPVPRPVIERILSVAQRTASWCNAQSWRAIVTSGEETARFRQALCDHAAVEGSKPDIPFPREYRGVHLERRRECGYRLYESVGIARGDRAGSAKQMFENFRLFGAPHVAILSSDEALGAYGAIDCGAFVSSFLLVAQSLGVATIAQASLAMHSDFLHRYFDIPGDRLIVCAISFGYEDEAHPANAFRTRRAGLEEVVTWRG